MSKFENQDKVFRFLLENFKKQSYFTKEEMQEASGWDKISTFNTYWPKQFKTLLVPHESDDKKFRVSEVFRRFGDEISFRKHVTQNRQISSEYRSMRYNKVVLFEFFMPLTNEGFLRSSLDALFYKDSVIRRLQILDESKLDHHFPKEVGESENERLKRVAEFISDKFGGYSVSHVSGRFRAAPLQDYETAYGQGEFSRYLVDETTAIVRFIFPCGGLEEQVFDSIDTDKEDDSGSEAEAAKVRFLFYSLFVKSIVEVINGEDEIWMLESGLRSRLHVWQMKEE